MDWHQPNQLREAMDFSLPDQPQNLDQILVDCKDALKYQVKTGEGATNVGLKMGPRLNEDRGIHPT